MSLFVTISHYVKQSVTFCYNLSLSLAICHYLYQYFTILNNLSISLTICHSSSLLVTICHYFSPINSKEFQDCKKSVTLRQTDRQTLRQTDSVTDMTRPREACASNNIFALKKMEGGTGYGCSVRSEFISFIIITSVLMIYYYHMFLSWKQNRSVYLWLWCKTLLFLFPEHFSATLHRDCLWRVLYSNISVKMQFTPFFLQKEGCINILSCI